MTLKILLPFGVYAEKKGIMRIIVETLNGSFGLLPHRLDCVAALVPGIMIYEKEGQSEFYVAVDGGVLVKTGPNVLVSVRNAIGGTNLGKLHEIVEREFLDLDNQDQGVRSVMVKLESTIIKQIAAFHT
jgi:F-type H+-transporting ATPase subunit epsilon